MSPSGPSSPKGSDVANKNQPTNQINKRKQSEIFAPQ